MGDAKKLVPLFVPPLATVLAAAEKTKGVPLTRAEAEAVRDRSVCIMMEPADAKKMAESRGYVDVVPENCWADWHRLQVQMTGKGYLPKVVLCIPGDADFRRRAEPILKEENVEHEFRGHDDKMVSAFRSSSMTWPCFKPEDYDRIAAHETVLYVLSKNFFAGAGVGIASVFLRLGAKLLDAGGIAVKCESSGISHSRERWSKLNDVVNQGKGDSWSALIGAYVVSPIVSATDFYTCGMHLLGLPDVIAAASALRRSVDTSAATAAEQLFGSFTRYLLAECPIGRFASGNTFQADMQSPRYRADWEPCTGYDDDDFYFNSFGRWRFVPA